MDKEKFAMSGLFCSRVKSEWVGTHHFSFVTKGVRVRLGLWTCCYGAACLPSCTMGTQSHICQTKTQNIPIAKQSMMFNVFNHTISFQVARCRETDTNNSHR
ncbi:hypothetical protein VPH35_058600 [Triticum aestivum]|uniref:Uncharacterized protein n=1 Tax=Aegilops tauschii subsp. strangulata TaxID=200361 RepID=A0A453E923_AEGTS